MKGRHEAAQVDPRALAVSEREEAASAGSTPESADRVERLINKQLRIMEKQLELLRSGAPPASSTSGTTDRAVQVTAPRGRPTPMRHLATSEQRASTTSETHALRTNGPVPTLPKRSTEPPGAEPFLPSPSEPATSGTLPLTDAQRDVWLVAQLDGAASAAYQISTKLRLNGDLDIDTLRESLRQLAGRHESLRLTFDATGERQIVRDRTDVDLPIVDLSDSADPVRARRVEEIIRSELNAPYDLEHGPLFRANLIRLEDAEYTLVLSAHHLICDGWSFGVLHRDLGAIYSALRRGEPAPPAEITQFSEYVDWHMDRVADSEQFWLDTYDEPPLPLDLPTDHARPPVRTFEGLQERALIERDVLVGLRELAAAEGVTLFTVLLGAWEILLHRLSGQRDFALGLFVAGQASMGARDLAGMCVNFLPLRGQLTPDESLSEFLTRLRWDMYDAYDHQHYTIGKLASTLKLPRDASRSTVVSTVITLETPTEGIHFDGLAVEASGNAKSYCAFDLEAYLKESEDALSIEFQYSSALFDSDTIRRWLGHFTNLLQQMTTASASPISRLQMLDGSQQDDLSVRWNDTQAPIPGEWIHQLFERQAGNDPDRVAIQTSGGSLTYRELNVRANRLARHLRGLGVGPGRLVGVHLHRSPDMVVALLAVHKAGGAYVPLDPLFPTRRLAMIAEDARPHVLISQGGLVGAIAAEGALVVALDRDLEAINQHDDSDLAISSQPSDLAYVIYTSGSTGVPKGVEVTNLALTNLLFSMQRRPGLVADDVLLAVTTISFDIAALEIFLPLIVGARLVLAGGEEAVDAIWLRERLGAMDITVMQATPATWQLLLDAGWQGTEGLKALCGGEALSQELAAAIGHRVESLWNMYGPTETTIWSSVAEVAQREGPVTLGQPIANTQLFVLGPALELQPLGIPGELYIGGIGLARGYWQQPDLTAERFVMHSFAGETPRRLYRTGDQVRRLTDGSIEFLGRADLQVKIRGYRIELGEIETVLARHPDVKDCVVVAKSAASGTKRLVAYLVPTGDHHDDVSALRMYLREFLPDYMVPSQFVVLDAFPLTANKKVDRAKLPDPDRHRPDLITELVAPRTEGEATLVRIWAELLDVEQVGINDNFFDLGGDSLLALRCVMRANRFGMGLAPISIFRHQTVAELALAAGEAAESRTDDQGAVTGPTPLTPAQLRFLTERDTPDAHYWNLSALVQGPHLSPSALRTAVRALLVHHDALRLRLWREGGRWLQETASPSEAIPFESHDVSQLGPQERTAAIERVCAELQASFDLDRGVLLRVAHFACGPGEPDRLFVVIHHFAADGLSWSVFWEDLEQAYRQAADGASVSLPPKTTSFRAWTTQLQQLAQTPRVVDTAEAWLRRPWNEVATLPADLDADARANTNGSAAQVLLELSAEHTRRLLGGHKRPDHVIIAALARCLSTWTASPTILIDILGHGRDAASDEVNLSRTVGFTLSYNPVVLRHPTWDATRATLEAVTAQIDAQPEGFSFELLRFLAPDPGLRDRLTGLPRAELLFNYSVNAATQQQGALWGAAAEVTGPEESPTGLRQYPLAVRATLAPNLRLAFVYSTALHQASTVEAMAAEVGSTIRQLLERR